MQRLIGLGVLSVLFALTLVAQPAGAQTTTRRPNIVVVVVDDAGFSDFGAFGGEARTPTIDALAQRGAQFTRYHTSPLCAPSRAMILTGVDSHRTGLATIPEVLPPEQRGRQGYTMRLEPGVETIADRLRRVGYRTYVTGKWHLGHGEGDLPNDHGFDRSFVLDASGADNWEQRPYMPYNDSAPWFKDGRAARLPADFYSSQFIVDQMISFLQEDATRTEPFFAYVAFQAVHIPVQAPPEFTAHYNGVYDAGWDALRTRRWERVQALNLIPTGAPLGPMHPRLRPWNETAPADRALYARSMQVHAGMLEALDHHLGRLEAYLAQRGLAENTIFVVTSDNGPEPSNPLGERGFAQWMAVQGYSRRIENLGERRSYNFIGPEWASATASPGALFKFYTGEGGLHAPLVVAGPGIPAARVDANAFVTDITPTLLAFAGADASSANGVVPISGRSMMPVLTGQATSVYGPEDAVGFEVSGNAALYRGDYKLVRNLAPYGDGAWRLFDLSVDPGETRDLSNSNPQLFTQMRAAYDAYARDVGVLDLPANYDVQHQVAANALGKQFEYYWWVLALIGVALIGLVALVFRWLRRRKAAR